MVDPTNSRARLSTAKLLLALWKQHLQCIERVLLSYNSPVELLAADWRAWLLARAHHRAPPRSQRRRTVCWEAWSAP